MESAGLAGPRPGAPEKQHYAWAGMPTGQDVAVELGLALVVATEAAALACARLIGRGDQEKVKDAGATAMLRALEELPLRGRIVLGPWGEGVLSQGTLVGSGSGPEVDLGVYPVEGASLVARGFPHALSMLVAVPPGSFPALPAVAYAEKIAVGPLARGAIEMDDTVADNLRRIAFARDARVQDLVVAVLDRPRHKDLVDEVRATGARIVNLEEGDIAAPLMAAADDTGVDVMMGIGGLQEAVMAASALRCQGGDLVARLWPRNDEEKHLAGAEAQRVYGVGDLTPNEVTVAITGISGGPLLKPVWFGSAWAETASLVMSSRLATVRRLTTRHHRVGAGA
jgi:fructose-1,6-bisphosphatase II